MAIILDGKKLSEKILGEFKKEVQKSGRKLKLVGILVGSDPVSKIFLKQKEKACKKVGVDFQLYRFPKNISQKTLAKKVREISQKKNQGIVIQLPLPRHINTQEILELIPPHKDVDLLSGKKPKARILAPVLAGILRLLKEYKIKPKGRKVVVVGKGRLVGRPIIDWLTQQKIKFWAVDSTTKDTSFFTKKADVLICGAGQPGLINGDMVKKGVVVVDAALDVDFKSVFPKASFITPIPGGVGPMTVAMVIKNLIALNK